MARYCQNINTFLSEMLVRQKWVKWSKEGTVIVLLSLSFCISFLQFLFLHDLLLINFFPDFLFAIWFLRINNQLLFHIFSCIKINFLFILVFIFEVSILYSNIIIWCVVIWGVIFFVRLYNVKLILQMDFWFYEFL